MICYICIDVYETWLLFYCIAANSTAPVYQSLSKKSDTGMMNICIIPGRLCPHEVFFS